MFASKEAPYPSQKLKITTNPIEQPPSQNGILIGGTCYWDPSSLPNPHIVAIGASGSGKTQTLKALAYGLNQGLKVQIIVVDFHGDQGIVGEETIEIHMSSEWGINPLIPNLDPEGGGPNLQAIQVIEFLRKLQLGANQEGLLLQTIKKIYADQGILQSDHPTWKIPAPNFFDLEAALEKAAIDNKDAEKLLMKLSATFQYGVFSKPQLPLTAPLLRVNLSKLPPALQSISAETLASQLMCNHRLSGESGLKTFLFIDEAKELRGSRSLDRIVADGRKYGLGLVVASQSERHLSKDIIGNSATKIVLPVDQTEVKAVAKKFRFSEQRISELQPLNALVRLGTEASATEVLPYYRRYSDAH